MFACNSERAMTDPDIYNWRRLGERLTTSGQPSEAQLRELRDLGVEHVVNLGLHTHERALPDEARSVADLGMSYVHIPVDFDHPTESDFIQFCETLERLDKAVVHVHCIANYRVSAFFYRHRRDVLGWDEAEARRDMDAVWPAEKVPAWAAFIAPKR
jgi:protein tyrosine phosphatase (PTP) superfamily phosphohydrolase (DUF442 family)